MTAPKLRFERFTGSVVYRVYRGTGASERFLGSVQRQSAGHWINNHDMEPRTYPTRRAAALALIK